MIAHGKVLMGLFAALSLLTVVSAWQRAFGTEPCGGAYEVIFIIDSSPSITNTEPNGLFTLQKDGLYDCICGPNASVPTDSTVAIAVIMFAGSIGTGPEYRIDLTLIDSVDTATELCNHIYGLQPWPEEFTNTQAALVAAKQIFEQSDTLSDCPPSDRLVILMTDGPPNKPGSPEQAADAACEAGEDLRTMPVPVRICVAGVRGACSNDSRTF